MVKNQKTVRDVLVVGCGSIGRRHISNLLSMDSIERIYIAAQHNHIPNELLKNERIIVGESIAHIHADMAVIANETQKHMSTAIQLAAAGINLFIEKPLSHTAEGFVELEALVKKHRLKVFVAYNMRFLKALQLIHKILTDKTIGDIYFARIEAGQYLPSWRPDRDYRTAYSANRSQGGGVALDLSHEIDYMRYLFGDPREWKVSKAKVSNLEISSDDVFEGIYTFNNFICNVHMDYLQHPAKREIRIVGSKGVIICDLINKYIKINKDSKDTIISEQELFDVDKTYHDELEDYIQSIEEDRDPSSTLLDGIKTLELLEERNV